MVPSRLTFSESMTRARLHSQIYTSMSTDMYTGLSPSLTPLRGPCLPSRLPWALPFQSVWERELAPSYPFHVPQRHLTPWPGPPVSHFSPGFTDSND